METAKRKEGRGGGGKLKKGWKRARPENIALARLIREIAWEDQYIGF